MLRRRNIAAAAISGLISVGLVGLAQPAIATTSDLIAAASLEPLSVAVATSTFPSGATTAVVAPVSPAVVAVQAAAFASSHDAPLILSASTTSADNSIAAMMTLGTDDVWLFGTDSSFSPAFVTAISGAATLTGSILDDTSLGRSSEALAATAGLELILVARGDRAADLQLAGSEAARAGSALVVLDGTETTAAVETAFAPYEDIEVLVLGDETTFPMLTLDEDQGEYLDLVRTADRDVVSLQVAERAMFSGAKGNTVVVAPNDQPVSVALAGLVAAARNGVVQVAGATASLGSSSAAAVYLGLWRSGATSVTLVGTGLTPASLTTVAAPALVAPAAAPAFRVTNVTVGATNHTITLTAASGATQYTAYDPMGTLVATSATPSLTIPGSQGSSLCSPTGLPVQSVTLSSDPTIMSPPQGAKTRWSPRSRTGPRTWPS